MRNENLDWLDEIETDDIFSGDLEMIKEHCGMDTVKKLLSNFSKISIYVSEKSLLRAKRKYIEANYHKQGAKAIAAKLGVSERFVHKAHKEIIQSKQQSTLFQDG